MMREKWINTAKGRLILLVVLGHSLQYLFCHGEHYWANKYLGTLGYDAVPAMGRLLHISLPYGSTEESVGQVVRDELLEIYFQDLNEEERVQIAEKSAEEVVRQLIGILMGKIEYQVVGKRKIAFQALARSVGVKVN